MATSPHSDVPERLLKRLDSIAAGLAATGQALALIGLGSVGLETTRLDAYSDLDFFAIVRPGTKAAFLADLAWMAAESPIAYAFMNTRDGYKVLYSDGLFAEFAVFEPQALESIPFAPGRLVWAAPGVDSSIASPRLVSHPLDPHPVEWLVGEALTNLLIGLGRCRRGEKLSGGRFVQGYAVDRILELAPLVEAEQPGFPDPFVGERRFEARFPGLAARLPEMIQGYDRSAESARAILQFLEEHFAINPQIKAAILALCQEV